MELGKRKLRMTARQGYLVRDANACDVISVDQVLQAARLDVEYFRGCLHGSLVGGVLGVVVMGALCYFFG